MTLPAGVSRRTVLAASAATVAAPLAVSTAAQAHPKGGHPETFHLSVLGTSYTHL
jgi:2',3'-cyclic-nucleotide 2'-phosphodiesterase/3'-nucleotidase